MKIEQLNIEIGKSYPASELLEKIDEKQNLEIQFGHIVIDYEKESKHKYFINPDFIKKLKKTPVKVYTIITRPSQKNFAYRLLELEDIKELLEKIENDNKLVCIINEDDLNRVNYGNLGIKKSVAFINKALKSNKMNLKAHSDKEGIMIKYNKINNKEVRK